MQLKEKRPFHKDYIHTSNKLAQRAHNFPASHFKEQIHTLFVEPEITPHTLCNRKTCFAS